MHDQPYLRLIIVIFTLFWSAQLMAKPQAPNILMVVVDDLGYGDSQAWFADSDKQTPTLNTLAAQGVKFTRFYTDSTCSTSRAALLTGQHPTRLGFHPVARGLPVELVTLPEYLKQQGYRTALIGKWHIGELYHQAMPNAQGFDYFFGYLNQWFLQGPAADGSLQLKPPIYYDPWLTENDHAMQPFKGYLPEILTAKTQAWLSQQTSDQPWFLMYATPLPHTPIVAPPEMPPTEDKDAIYRAMVKRVDDDLGRILTTLKRSEQLENTLVIVLSDNGAPRYLPGSNAGFPGGKSSYAESAVRVPMVWRWPKNFLPVKTVDADESVFVTDIYPSLVSYLAPWVSDDHELANRDGRDIFTEPSPAELRWLTRTGYSVLRGNERFSGNWIFQSLFERSLETVGKTSSVSVSVDEASTMALEQSFKQWLDDVSRIALIESASGVYRGNDFLRTPLINWDFYIALKSPLTAATSNEPQWLAGQPGSWQLTWDGRELDLQMHGGRWQVRLPADDKCHFIGIHADLYDRFTNLTPSINLSWIVLTLDGHERLNAKWQIDDLSPVDITQPLHIGVTPNAAFKKWRGQLSEPQLFHRANRIGHWTFQLDEKQLQQQLCEQLTD